MNEISTANKVINSARHLLGRVVLVDWSMKRGIRVV
jgi:hypothetical protein